MAIQQEFQKYFAQVRSDFRDASGGEELPGYVNVTKYYEAGKTPLQAALAIYRKLNSEIVDDGY